VALGEVWSRIRAVRLVPFLGAVLLATITFPLRTVRWRYLLQLEGVTLPFVPLWHATAIGFMGNNLLPARAGEVARMYAASKLTSVKFAAALGSIAVERVLDGLTLVALLVVAILAGGFTPQVSIAGMTVAPAGVARVGAAVFMLVLIGCLTFVYAPRPFLGLARWMTGRLLPTSWGRRLMEFLDAVLAGLDVLKSPGRLVRSLFWSLVVWSVMGASFWMGLVAFDVDASWSTALMLETLIAFGVAIPSTPGFFGPFEAATRVSFALYGLDETSAASFAVGYHIATFIPITLLGIWSLGRASLALGDLRADVKRPERAGAGRSEGA
jgi:uncharacterized protein (TIRG00374 family)